MMKKYITGDIVLLDIMKKLIDQLIMMRKMMMIILLKHSILY